MLYRSLLFLQEQLNAHFKVLNESNANIVVDAAEVQNIGTMEEDKLKNAENLFITLVNISEEATLKNIPHYKTENQITTYSNPPIYLNLFVLFTACFKKYEQSLIQLSEVIRFFQAKNNFTKKNSSSVVIDSLDDFNIVMDLFSPTFEQVNYLWSTLGGKQHPFALYKLRVVMMERESTFETRGVIKQITVTEETTQLS
jgi:Pvc16 N-terminal domain